MKKFNYKSRKGFTLIELLVVIGILAVLAAIAIPSVAGLIDRANVSADDTNANEMTNALERFTSEYELFCQDIASGRFDPDDLDSAQSRVYNVTGADSRDDITQLESEIGLDGKKINRDTKYPENVATTKAIVENYTKTSSATYEPKQSDMHFYYSPDCGVVVFAEASETMDEDLILALNKKIVSGKNAKGQELGSDTTWINLTVGVETDPTVPKDIVHGGNVGDLIPEGATYFDASTNTTLIAGKPFPETVGMGDKYEFGDYRYEYQNVVLYDMHTVMYENTETVIGWQAYVKENNNKEIYDVLLSSINGSSLVSTKGLFAYNNTIKTVVSNFKIPSTVISVNEMFSSSTVVSLPDTLTIPNGVKDANGMFFGSDIQKLPSQLTIPSSVVDMQMIVSQCEKLEYLPSGFRIPVTVTDPEVATEFFAYCRSLKRLPEGFSIPLTATNCFAMFTDCASLEEIPSSLIFHENVKDVYWCFLYCENLGGTITFNCNPTRYSPVFGAEYQYKDTAKTVTITGSSPILNKLAEGSNYKTVIVA